MQKFLQKSFNPRYRKRYFLYFFITTILTLIFSCGWIQIALAQFSLNNFSNNNSGLLPPDNVSRYGNIETTWIKLPRENKELFEIASNTVYNRENLGENEVPVEVRAKIINANLRRAIRNFRDTKSLQIVVAKLNKLTVLEVVDDKNSRPLVILTVTELDARYNLKTEEELAKEWKAILQENLLETQKLFSTEEFLRRLSQAFGILVGILIASGLVWIMQRLVNFQSKSLKAQQETVKSPNTSNISNSSPENEIVSSAEAVITGGEYRGNEKIARMQSHFISRLKKQFKLKDKLSLNTSLRWLFLWLQILIWYFGVVWIMLIIPGLKDYGIRLLGLPIQILLIMLVTSFAIRIIDAIISRITNAWKNHEFLSLGEAQRKALRVTTIYNAITGLANTILIIIAFLLILNVIGIPTSSILALGAFLGFAITFGSQSLVKDLVNGCLILLEDQYAVGDVINLGSVGGLVENMNLRVTQLRDVEGSLITIPNSLINQVKNLTRNWSRVDFGIEIAYDTDLKKTLALLNQIALAMYNESQWKDKIIAPPEVLGVDSIAHTGMLIKVWIKTAPLQQWSVGREFRYRVRIAFEEHGIDIGKPQWITYNTNIDNDLSDRQKPS